MMLRRELRALSPSHQDLERRHDTVALLDEANQLRFYGRNVEADFLMRRLRSRAATDELLERLRARAARRAARAK
jgi:hypothetical protein